jgi:NAD(P)-dependent dehydrogenase (short-subunit alcohol dehydrogenase family)
MAALRRKLNFSWLKSKRWATRHPEFLGPPKLHLHGRAKQVRSIVGDRLDVLVLNAGISEAARIADHTVEDFDSLFATNVRGPFFVVQHILPVLGEDSSIVAISSLGACAVPGKPGLGTLTFLFTARPKEHLRRWSRTGRPFSGRAVYALTLLRQA